ncbi:MAG TPA: UTP--glucose-1-phosphate uridylyltransferase [Firmicutes bacterium]|nr:UTP--glucose-1-phosphate uridylyltransferase [Bacillota bacterium]
MQRVKKAIIPAAGLGTRFLPATKSMPKEMLPIVDTPTIQFIVEEAVKSGIDEILIITNSNKHSMENYFDLNYELEMRLKEAGKNDLVDLIRQVASLANIHYVRQKEPKGLGHAILCARTFVGNEPFAVLLGDDMVVNQGKPALLQLVEAYNQKTCSILGVQEVLHTEVNKYGIVTPSREVKDGKKLFKVVDMVEKPDIDKAESDYAVLGRYILTPEIFDILSHTEPGKNGEIQLTDAIRDLMVHQPVYACDFVGTRYDVGDKFGYVKATIDYSLRRADMSKKVKDYIKELAKNFN